jgi:hypothetical protein
VGFFRVADDPEANDDKSVGNLKIATFVGALRFWLN